MGASIQSEAINGYEDEGKLEFNCDECISLAIDFAIEQLKDSLNNAKYHLCPTWHIDFIERQIQSLEKQKEELTKNKQVKTNCVVCGNQYDNPNNDSDTCYNCREPHCK